MILLCSHSPSFIHAPICHAPLVKPCFPCQILRAELQGAGWGWGRGLVYRVLHKEVATIHVFR
jgi:hypothetical protein